MRKIITRTIVSYIYTVNVADRDSQSFTTTEVETTVILKHPERQLAKYLPENLVYISHKADPEIKQNKVYMELKDFLTAAKPYKAQDGDSEE